MGTVISALLQQTHMIGIMALTTLGIALTYKTANTANFAQSITATTGSFTAAFLLMRLGMPVWVAALGGVLTCFLLGLVIDGVIIRHVSASGNGRVMITLGLIILITAFLPMVFGMIPYTFERFFDGLIEFELFGEQFTVTKNSLFILCASIVIVAIVFLALNLTKWGLGMRATASNSAVASMLGINTNNMTAISWGISSACAALGAIFLSSQNTNVNINMLATVQTASLLSFIMGGFTSFYAPVIGAVIMPFATALLPLISGLWYNVLLYVFVLLVILIRPNGLFGKQAIKKV